MKELLKDLLVPFLASRPVSAIATRVFGCGIPIFMIHRTVTVESTSRDHSTALLRQYLQYLKDEGYSFASVMDVIGAIRNESKLPPKSVVFTVDDGYLHQAETTAPVFIEFDCPVTIFLITGFLDGQLWPWFSQVAYILENCRSGTFELDFPENKLRYNISDTKSRSEAKRIIIDAMKTLNDAQIPLIMDELSRTTQVDIPLEAPGKYRPMTWDLARDLEKKGITFGPHTVSHPILSMVDKQKSEREITESWKRLKEEMTTPVPILCYPNGKPDDYGAREIDIIRKAGLIGAVTTINRQVDIGNSNALYEYNIPRLSFPNSLQDLIQYSTWIEHAKFWH